MAYIWILCIALFAGAASGEGDVSVLESYPSLAQVEFLSILDLDTWTQECTASILTARYMLSAASCFSGVYYQRELRRFRAGSSTLETGGYLAEVEIAINYPEWDETNHDISVIRLLNPLTYSSVIQQATIAGIGSVIPEGIVVNQIGWGNTTDLSVSEIYIANTNLCGQVGDEEPYVADSILCGVPRPSANSDNLDVGSPWLFANITLGVVAGANGDHNNNWSGILTTSVPYYASWIVSVAA